VIVARADTDVFVNIDQPLDMHFQPNLFAHLAVQGFEQRLAVVDLPPGITHWPQNGSMQRRVRRTWSPPSMMQATTEVLMCCLIKSIEAEYRIQATEYRREANARSHTLAEGF